MSSSSIAASQGSADPLWSRVAHVGVAVFDEMRKGLQQIESIKQPDVGELRIGSSIVTDAGLLPAIIERFSQEFPRAVVHVLPENIAIQQYENLPIEKPRLYSVGFRQRCANPTWSRRRYLMSRIWSSPDPRVAGPSGES